MIIKDLGLIDYREALQIQENLFNQAIQQQKNQEKTTDYLLFCEHQPVFTIGRSGKLSNLLIDTETMDRLNISLYNISRGGDITFHGPGQLVVYPIINLKHYGIYASEYVSKIEETIIQTLKEFNIKSDRLKGATGVWLDATRLESARKICAIGVKVSRWITMHGLALNVNTKLNYFNYINPCGFTDKGVSSIEKEIGERVDMTKVKEIFAQKFNTLFGQNVIN